MPDLSLTPARVTAGAVKAVASGWIKSVKVAVRIGWFNKRIQRESISSTTFSFLRTQPDPDALTGSG